MNNDQNHCIDKDILEQWGTEDLKHYCLGVTNNIDDTAKDRNFVAAGEDFLSWEIKDMKYYNDAVYELQYSDLTVLEETAIPPCTVYVFRRTANSVPPIEI